MSVRRLPSGRWQAVVHLSLGSCMHKEEAEALVHAHQASQQARACTKEDAACRTTPAPALAGRTPQGTTERQAGSLRELLKRYLSAATLARLEKIQGELQVDALEQVLDYLVSDNCWDYT